VDRPDRYFYYQSAVLAGGVVISYLIGSIYERYRQITEKNLIKLSSELSHVSKMSSLGEMASGISHEINNPVSIIMATSALLRKKIDNGVAAPELIQAELLKVEQTAKRISNIINGMTKLSRSNETDPMSEIGVNELIEEAFQICVDRFRVAGIELRLVNHASDLKIEVQISLMLQVFVNLLNNAFDAVEKLPEKWVEMRAEVVGKFLVVSVIDSGPGIPAEVVQKMMEPFFTTKQIGKGTGLGLSISRSILEQHHGDLSYDPNSTYTRFNLKLPL
jgi:C4-dicarboxylate-specific signal transduction histidine kinase